MTTGLTPVNPRPFLAGLINQVVVVKLKWGMEYRGTLKNADAYMNLQLGEAEEYIDGTRHGVQNELLIRCNNILYIRTLDEAEDAGGSNNGEEE